MTINPMTLIKSVVSEDNPSVPAALFEVGDFTPFKNYASDLEAAKGVISSVLPGICFIVRQTKDGHNEEFVGTGFVIAHGLVMTNLHVAKKFFTGKGGDNGFHNAFVCFGNDIHGAARRCAVSHATAMGKVNDKLPVYWEDIAVLCLTLPDDAPANIALTIGRSAANSYNGGIVTIGYPAILDSTVEVGSKQDKVFGAAFGSTVGDLVKRISPGQSVRKISNGQILEHDCSTLKGNSGSPLIDLATGYVIGVHRKGFEGVVGSDLKNHAVPCDALIKIVEALNSDDAAIIIGKPSKASRARAGSPGYTRATSFGILKDIDDFRDLPYRPSLAALSPARHNAIGFPGKVLNQGKLPTCTGHALVHLLGIINKSKNLDDLLSVRMAYEMARIHDDLPGRDTDGSTLRGVIKGYFHNGLALPKKGDMSAPLKPWHFDLVTANKARENSLGAYFRLNPTLTDYHAALHEVEAILVSARVHEGWEKPEDNGGEIPFKSNAAIMGHAFVIVGYDTRGFIVLNSAGHKWGRWEGQPGRAHWSYEDWSENLLDGWVLRPAVPAPSAFGKQVRSALPLTGPLPLPRRSEILGHMLLSDQGQLSDFGRSATSFRAAQETATLFKSKFDDSDHRKGQQKYQHLLFIAHAETTTEEDAQRWVNATKPFFKQNRIYPVSLVCDPEHATAFRDLVASVKREAAKRLPVDTEEYTVLLQSMLTKFGPKLWKSYTESVQAVAEQDNDFWKSFLELAKKGRAAKLKLHFVGHLSGCILAKVFLSQTRSIRTKLDWDSLHFLASTLAQDDHIHLMSKLSRSPKRSAKSPPSVHTYRMQRLARYGNKEGSSELAGWLTLVETSFAPHVLDSGSIERRFTTGHDDIWLPDTKNLLIKDVPFKLLATTKADETAAMWDSGFLNHLARSITQSSIIPIQKLPLP